MQRNLFSLSVFDAHLGWKNSFKGSSAQTHLQLEKRKSKQQGSIIL